MTKAPIEPTARIMVTRMHRQPDSYLPIDDDIPSTTAPVLLEVKP